MADVILPGVVVAIVLGLVEAVKYLTKRLSKDPSPKAYNGNGNKMALEHILDATDDLRASAKEIREATERLSIVTDRLDRLT